MKADSTSTPLGAVRKGRGLPFRITLLLWLVLIITALSATRTYAAIAWRGSLSSYVSTSTTTYIAVSGALWTVVWLLVLWSFWQRARYTRTILLVASALYAAWFWVDRLVIQAGPRPNSPFALVATLLLLGYTAAIVLDSRNQPYFRKETYERKPERPPAA